MAKSFALFFIHREHLFSFIVFVSKYEVVFFSQTCTGTRALLSPREASSTACAQRLANVNVAFYVFA